MNHRKTILTAIMLLACAPVLAHPGHAPAEQLGLAAGLLHPLTGLDHLLAMLGAGVWSARQGRAGGRLALAFLAMLACGAVAGAAGGMRIAGLESGMALTVLSLGVLLALAARLPHALAAVLMGAFAVLHGNAHGLELPQLGSAVGYMTTSALLLGLGLALGSRANALLLRVGGVGLAAMGMALLAL